MGKRKRKPRRCGTCGAFVSRQPIYGIGGPAADVCNTCRRCGRHYPQRGQECAVKKYGAGSFY